MTFDPAKILDDLAKFSRTKRGVTRLPYSAEHRLALEYLQDLMREAGLETRVDAAGTLFGTRKGGSPRKLLFGSHQDSVVEGGAFDGIMGVVLPICALAEIDEPLPFSVEVLAFADEEGVRFPTALVGSRALAGSFDPVTLAFVDSEGESIREAITNFGLEPDDIAKLAYDPSDVMAYVEVHIEQGPVLEAAGAPLGVVTEICGIERHAIRFLGVGGHAGTVPMRFRKDALVGASAFIEKVHEMARANAGVLATVGQIHVRPNVVNAIPFEVDLTLEIRAGKDAAREAARAEFLRLMDEIAVRFDLQATSELTYSQEASPCDVGIISALSTAVQRVTNMPVIELPSGATHDASAMADLCPIGMMFVRCEKGLSHHPDEFVSPQDLRTAVDAIREFVLEKN